MKFIKRMGKAFHSRVGAYAFYALAAAAFTFLYSAEWAYAWIAELYPLGKNFVPTLFCVIGLCAAAALVFLILGGNIKSRVPRVIHTVCCVLSGFLFVYTAALLFGLDKGFQPESLGNGLASLAPSLPYLGLALGVPLAFVFCESPRKRAQAALLALLMCAVVVVPMLLPMPERLAPDAAGLPPIRPQSQNILEGHETSWTAQPRAGFNNAVLELELTQQATFNMAVLEEMGNEVQYFRLQALVDGEWVTFYRSEKIQAMRLCGFDAVTTDRVRLSIDKFRSGETPARIRSLRLYNEPTRDAGDFEVAAYQRLDGDVPTEVLAKGEEYVNTYARYYDVYSTVIVFAAVRWDENGDIAFGVIGEAGFARELAALREIIAHRANREHEVKIIVTTLADGAWEGMQGGVNAYMHEHWESVADQTLAFVQKYGLQGVDIDWEYPQNTDDWLLFDRFIARLDDGLKARNPGAILSGALSSWGLGMSAETLRRFGQIQFMAYDGRDADGYQSSLQQAQEGLRAFIGNGADIGKINIGIAAYGRPLNGTPFWKAWRDLEQANYWDSKYYNVPDGGQVYDGTFCAPALAGDKTAYALLSGAGGVMVFRVACDKRMDDPNSVARGIENALQRYVVGW